ncbi:expressed unknown protein [Seminavis robusta]|uniref:Transmembrane protein n=1 Tax=Seminavis robusta TaxID=568900 RepID=A0A9N8D540_9STRA|nr:expressed unknown protein [Seminavis robusta]|eukprot:Sro3_g002140.1 n/a (181) ;mRNA; f:66076-66618
MSSEASQRMQSEDLGMFMGIGGCCLLFFWMPWIVLDLVFAGGDSECLTQEITEYSISMDLATWLQVQAAIMIVLAGILMVAAIMACFTPIGALLGGCGLCLLTIHPLFSMPWTIVGALMFWGELDPAGTCDRGLTIYMYFNLIIGCFSIFSCCCRDRVRPSTEQTAPHDAPQKTETSPIV